MPRKKLFSGLYACPICEDEFELFRASDSERLCPVCQEPLEPVLETAGNETDSGEDEDSQIG